MVIGKHTFRTARGKGAVSGGTPVPAYLLRRSARRTTIELSVDPAHGLVVAAPASVAQQEIDAFVHRKARWVKKALENARERRRQLHRDFVSGESIPYLGRDLPLTALDTAGARSGVEQSGERLQLRIAACDPAGDRRAAAIAALERWYRARAQIVLAKRVEHFSLIIAVAPRAVVIKAQKTRWGSCGRHGTLYFNWRLMLAPMDVVDYLVVHELCHLRQRGHGRRFWRLVGRVLPDFEACEADLRRNGWRYRLE